MLAKSLLRMTYRLIVGSPAGICLRNARAREIVTIGGMSTSSIALGPIVREILRGYRLDPHGIHGVQHWARVLENGLRLARVNGADERVVTLFAIFHDSRRWNDLFDPPHGRRGAELATELRGKLFELPDAEFELLYRACEWHTEGREDPSVTVRTCWDADRLDLPRLGIVIDPNRLCTEEARDPQLIAWADRRGWRGHVSPFVAEDWLLDQPV